MPTDRPATGRVLGTAIVLASAAFAGCESIGPRTMPRDRFDYNAAIASSTDEQLLLNLVRLRYSETPVFLRVDSVIAQYSQLASVQANAGVNTSPIGGDAAAVGGRLVWTDRPTITYSPLTGQEFSRNILTPIEPANLFGLMQAGWPGELVMTLTVWSINDVENAIARPSRRRSADPEMMELLAIWGRLRDDSALGLREVPAKDGGRPGIMLTIEDEGASDATRADVRRMRELLELSDDVDEFRVRYGRVPRSNDEIAVLTGSIWDVMLNLSWQFEAPGEDVESGRTAAALRTDRGAPLRVLHAAERPDRAYVAIERDGRWFYIDEHDRRSKRAFSFLQILLNLAESDSPDRSPAITISS